jgi:ribonuclease HI
MKKVEVITDGSCLKNPGGPGGWAAILLFGKHRKELFGCEPSTTNNRMEMRAAIEGLRALSEPCQVKVTTDSQYLKNGITKWIKGWKRRGWITREGTPVLNRELWLELDEQCRRHQMEWAWTRGHADHADNNRCDELATQAAQQQIASR